MITALGQDLRYAVRLFTKKPGFTAVAVVALALGIGANTAIFSLVDGLIYRPVNYPNVDRLAAVYATPPNQPDRARYLSSGDFVDWRREMTSFETLSASSSRNFTMTDVGDPVQIEGAVASPGLFEALGSAPLLGRTFRPEEERPGTGQVAIIHHAFWQNHLAADPGIVGRTISLDGQPFTVVGVMGPGFDFPLGADLWVPFEIDAAAESDRTTPQIAAVGLLKPGVSVEQAAAEMRAVAARLADAHPETNSGRSAYVVPLAEDVITSYTRGFMAVLAAAVGLVLLIACANVSNLQLARATSRRREIAVRFALGASRWRVARQLLLESVLLALAGCAAGTLLAQLLVDLVKDSIPAAVTRYVPGLMDLTLDLKVLAISVALSAVAGIVAGLVPALQSSSTQLGEAMKDASKGVAAGRGTHRTRSALVVSEIALTLTLLVVAGLLTKYFVTLVTHSNGYDPSDVLTLRVTLPEQQYGEPKRVAAFYDDVLGRFATIPGVESVAAAKNLPGDGASGLIALTVDGRPTDSPSDAPMASPQVVSPAYFETLRIPVVDGRDFAEQDRADTLPVAIVSESLRRRIWPDESPIGKRLKLANVGGEATWLTVVGVAGDVKYEWVDRAATPMLYVPLAQTPRQSMFLTLRVANPLGVAAAARAHVLAVDPVRPVFAVRTLEGVYADSIAGIRIVVVLLMIFGAMALVLATVGVYGVMAYTVAQRRHEVGIRLALGAQPRDVLRIVVGQALKMAVVGLALGVPLAALLGMGLSSVLDGAIPFDPISVGAFMLMLCAIVALASFLPARRAARTDPAEVLRGE